MCSEIMYQIVKVMFMHVFVCLVPAIFKIKKFLKIQNHTWKFNIQIMTLYITILIYKTYHNYKHPLSKQLHL